MQIKHNFHKLSFKELLDATTPFWNELPEEQKEAYKEKAKYQNKRAERKRTYVNPTVLEIEEKRQKLNEKQDLKRRIVEDLIFTANDLGDLEDKVFHFVYVSTYFENAEDVFPAELGLLKFSLRKGIIDSLHVKISPGKMPFGAAYLSLEKSKQTHKYRISSNEENVDDDDGESSFILILLKIMDFINDDEDFPVLFTDSGDSKNNELHLVERALVKIFEGGCEYQIASELKVTSVQDLFYYLNKVANDSSDETERIQTFLSYPNAVEHFSRSRSVFQFIAKGCPFHEYHDISRHCSLSKVTSYAYIISKFCVNPTKHPLIEGRHFPMGYQVA